MKVKTACKIFCYTFKAVAAVILIAVAAYFLIWDRPYSAAPIKKMDDTELKNTNPGNAGSNGAGLADTGVWSASDLALIRRLHPKDVRVSEPADKPQEPEEPQVEEPQVEEPQAEEPQEPQEPLSRIEQIFDAINATVSG